MKLKLSAYKPSSDYSYKYSITIITLFSALYFIIPYLLEPFVGDDFYVYSHYQSETFIYSLFCFISLIFCTYIVTQKAEHFTNIACPRPSLQTCKIIFWLNFIYLIKIILIGILANGADRITLLGLISKQLFPGYGYILLLVLISIIHIKRDKYLFLFFSTCVIIDILYHGKIFSTYALMLTMFYLDDKKIKLTIRRLLLIGVLGITFLFSIFIIRAITSGSGFILNIYSFFSEFIGVNATIGWGYEYTENNLPPSFTEYDSVLQNYYIQEVGHGLALSPVAYFLGNFGHKFSFFIGWTLYILLLLIIYSITIRFIGRYALLILLYNFIHLLRHGPDIFLSNSITQSIFLIAILIAFSSINKKSVLTLPVNRNNYESWR